MGFGGSPAAAHEEGVIRLGARSAAVGQEIEVRGEQLPESTDLRLVLAGALATHPLMVVRSDSAGEFVQRLAIPQAASPGLYRVVAVAPDGDEVARAEIVVVAAAAAIEPAPAAAGAHGAHATDATMELATPSSAAERAAIAIMIALAAIGGVVLLRRSP
jgi:hypothetical protein